MKDFLFAFLFFVSLPILAAICGVVYFARGVVVVIRFFGKLIRLIWLHTKRPINVRDKFLP